MRAAANRLQLQGPLFAGAAPGATGGCTGSDAAPSAHFDAPGCENQLPNRMRSVAGTAFALNVHGKEIGMSPVHQLDASREMALQLQAPPPVMPSLQPSFLSSATSWCAMTRSMKLSQMQL